MNIKKITPKEQLNPKRKKKKEKKNQTHCVTREEGDGME